jgi:hypothetical protein
VGTPKILVPPPCGFGISTARTGGGKYVPEDIRFQIRYKLLLRSASNSPMDWPSTPAAPSFALTLLYASHTSLFKMSNDLPFGSDLPTRVLPDQVRLFARTKPRMSQPLRSTPITGASSLLRAGPPARPHRYSTPHSFCCLTHSLSHPPPCRNERSIGPRLPTFRVVAADQTRAAFTPGTAWPINGHPPDSSRGFAHTPILVPSPVFRRFINGSLSLAFLIPA